MQLSIKNCPVASRQINPPLSAMAGSKQCLGKRQRGVTLIELMIVVAIIGILAAVAIPAYSDYLKKARTAEPQVLFSGIKTALETFYQEEARFPTNEEFYQFELVTTGNDVKETRYFFDPQYPRIEMVVAGFPEPENVIAWQWMADLNNNGNMIGRWSCKPFENGGFTTIRFKYLPKVCRG